MASDKRGGKTPDFNYIYTYNDRQMHCSQKTVIKKPSRLRPQCKDMGVVMPNCAINMNGAVTEVTAVVKSGICHIDGRK